MTHDVVYGFLPEGVQKHGETKLFTDRTAPKALTNEHATKESVWGLICVETGSLDYQVLGEEHQAVSLTAGQAAVVKPAILHRVQPGPESSFKVEFYSEPSS